MAWQSMWPQRTLSWLVVAAALVACGQSVEDPAEQQLRVVRGVAMHAERLPLGNRARLVAELRERTPDDDPRLISEEVLEPPGQFPFRFELQYSPAQISAEGQLMLEVRVYDDGELLFINEPLLPIDRRSAADVLEVQLAATDAGQARLTQWQQQRAAEAEAEAEPAAPAFELPPPPEPDFDSEELSPPEAADETE